MTVFHRLTILAAGFALLAPLPAAADHDTVPQPAQPPADATPAPPFEPKKAFNSGGYYIMSFDLGGVENADTDADFSVDTDWATGLEFGGGYRLSFVRLEAELYTRFSRVGSLDLGGGAPFPAADYKGGIWTSGLMGNLYIDLPRAGKMRPYVGVGYGITRVSVDYNESLCFIFCFKTDNEVLDDYDIVQARQLLLGASFSHPTEKSEFFLGYRYFETEDFDLTTNGGDSFRHDGVVTHTFSIGIRFLI